MPLQLDSGAVGGTYSSITPLLYIAVVPLNDSHTSIISTVRMKLKAVEIENVINVAFI